MRSFYWKGFAYSILFNSTTPSKLLTTLNEKAFENIVGKGENANNQHFLIFPQCFLPFPKQAFVFLFKFIMSSANALNLDQSRILSFALQSGKTRACLGKG